MASPIAETWIFATMLICNQWDSCGTGFLVKDDLHSVTGSLFLITNKHVISADSAKRYDATSITVYGNVTRDGKTIGQRFEVPLIRDNVYLWNEHPDPDVDVLAINVSSLLNSNPNLMHLAVSYELFADSTVIDSLDITIGEEVYTIGYPSKRYQGRTYLPIVRKGIIATMIGQEYIDYPRLPDGNRRRRTNRGFLIDGATIPGSSGSPVVLRPTGERYMNGDWVIGLIPEPFLLGIVSQTYYAPIEGSDSTAHAPYVDLGLAYDAITIRETIDRYFREKLIHFGGGAK